MPTNTINFKQSVSQLTIKFTAKRSYFHQPLPPFKLLLSFNFFLLSRTNSLQNHMVFPDVFMSRWAEHYTLAEFLWWSSVCNDSDDAVGRLFLMLMMCCKTKYIIIHLWTWHHGKTSIASSFTTFLFLYPSTHMNHLIFFSIITVITITLGNPFYWPSHVHDMTSMRFFFEPKLIS